MKRFLVFVVIAILIGAGFGLLIDSTSTYVLIRVNDQAFESTVWFFLIAVIFFFILFNLSMAILSRLYRPGRRFESWAFSRSVEASKRDFFQAIIDFETGAWDKALKKFRAAANNLDRPIVAYLYAARTAQKLGRPDLREEMLHEAAQLEPESSLAIGITRAEMLIEEKHYEEARNLVGGLLKASPKNHRLESILGALPAAQGEE